MPKRVMSGELENAVQHGLGRKEKERTDCVAEDRRVFRHYGGLEYRRTRPWGLVHDTAREGGFIFKATWVTEEDKASENLQREVDKVDFASGGYRGKLETLQSHVD